MSVEFVGSVLPRRESELLPPVGPLVQPVVVRHIARAYEQSSFDCVQIDQSATSVDAVVLAQAVLGATEQLSVLVSLPPQVIEPVPAARAIATLATLYPGRVHARVPVVTREPTRHVEFAKIVQSAWRSPVPFAHSGRHYDLKHWSVLCPEPVPELSVQLHVSEDEDAAIVPHADVCYLPADGPNEVAARVLRCRELARGRQVRFGIAIRPIVGTDDAAVAALCRHVVRVAPTWKLDSDADGAPIGLSRLLRSITRAAGGVDPFVGTIQAVAERLNEYVKAGIEVFQVRGFDPLADVDTYSAVVDEVLRLTDVDRDRSSDVSHVA